MVGLVGSSNNPVSGMAIATLLIATALLKVTGDVGSHGMQGAIAIGSIICIIACMAGAQYRRSGSAALDLAYVAAGRFDGYFELGLKPWDIAAGELIIKEAGGTVVDARGGSESMENGQVLACSMKMLKPLMQAVVPAWGEAAK